MKNMNFEKAIIILITLLGILLSILQFIYNRSLWLDEGYLSLNIINRSYFELLKPLDLQQVAPILFLQIEKLFSELIPNSEFGLRIFPLISYLISLFFLYKILQIIHKNYYSIIFSLSLFVFNATLIYYASEAKQYSTDVLVLTTLFYFILKEYKNQKNKYFVISVVGAVSIFLTNVSPIILFTCGLYLLFEIYQNNRNSFSYLIVVSLIWISTFLFYYYIFIHNHPSRDLMIEEWGDYKAFMPVNPFKIDFLKFLNNQRAMVFGALFNFGKIAGICLFLLSLLGIVYLIIKKEFGIIILTITPLVLHLLLSGFKLYPFALRLILYTLPSIIILCSFGFNYLVSILFTFSKIERSKLLAIIIPSIFLSIFLYRVEYPINKLETKECIRLIEQNMYKEDKVYVNYLSSISFQYYHDISFFEIDSNNIILGQQTIFWNGNTWDVDTVKYAEDLNLLKGRLWFLFTGVGNEHIKKEFLINYCESKNFNIIQEFHYTASDVYLCEFIDHE